MGTFEIRPPLKGIGYTGWLRFNVFMDVVVLVCGSVQVEVEDGTISCYELVLLIRDL